MTDGRVHLVRHAKAGSRGDWDGADDLRPLSRNGWKQAEAIAARLAKRAPSLLLSSPYLRCKQTLEPLSLQFDLEITNDPRLGEGQPFGPVVEMLETLPTESVLCSHGDVIPETIAALQRRGCRVETPADWRKGTIWTIERTGDELTHAHVWWPSI